MPIIVNQIESKPEASRYMEGEKSLLVCSGCDKPLCYIVANQPNVNVDLKIKVDCCYCDDHSFPFELHGMFAAKGYETESGRPLVNIIDVDFNGPDVTIETEKV